MEIFNNYIIIVGFGILLGFLSSLYIFSLEKERIIKPKDLFLLNEKKFLLKEMLIIICMDITICLFLFIKFGAGLEFCKYTTFILLMAIIGIVDFKTQYIYNSTIILGVLAAALFICLNIGSGVFPINEFLGGLIGYFVIYFIEKITKGLGEGDKEVSFVIGFFIGMEKVLYILLIAGIIGSVVSIILVILKKQCKNSEIAFCPYLAIASMFVLLIF